MHTCRCMCRRLRCGGPLTRAQRIGCLATIRRHADWNPNSFLVGKAPLLFRFLRLEWLGCVAGAVVSTVMNPLEITKTRLQTQVFNLNPSRFEKNIFNGQEFYERKIPPPPPHPVFLLFADRGQRVSDSARDVAPDVCAGGSPLPFQGPLSQAPLFGTASWCNLWKQIPALFAILSSGSVYGLLLPPGPCLCHVVSPVRGRDDPLPKIVSLQRVVFRGLLKCYFVHNAFKLDFFDRDWRSTVACRPTVEGAVLMTERAAKGCLPLGVVKPCNFSKAARSRFSPRPNFNDRITQRKEMKRAKPEWPRAWRHHHPLHR